MYLNNNNNNNDILNMGYGRSVTVCSLPGRRSAETCALWETRAGGVVSSVSCLDPTIINVISM